MMLETYAAPLYGLPVDQVDTVLAVLKPLWQAIPETALRGRIEAVLDFAKARGWRSGENPAAWRGHLALILPKRGRLTRGHHAAMPYQNLPEFIGKLREHRSVSAAAYPLEFAKAGSRQWRGEACATANHGCKSAQGQDISAYKICREGVRRGRSNYPGRTAKDRQKLARS
jgi:hypothetical protein